MADLVMYPSHPLESGATTAKVVGSKAGLPAAAVLNRIDPDEKLGCQAECGIV